MILTKILATLCLLTLIAQIIGLFFVRIEGDYYIYGERTKKWFRIRNYILATIPFVLVIMVWVS